MFGLYAFRGHEPQASGASLQRTSAPVAAGEQNSTRHQDRLHNLLRLCYLTTSAGTAESDSVEEQPQVFNHWSEIGLFLTENILIRSVLQVVTAACVQNQKYWSWTFGAGEAQVQCRTFGLPAGKPDQETCNTHSADSSFLRRLRLQLKNSGQLGQVFRTLELVPSGPATGPGPVLMSGLKLGRESPWQCFWPLDV